MWTKLSDEFFRNPKVVAAGRDARDLYLVSLCHCNEHLTDGFIAQNYLRRMAADAEIDSATEAALMLVEVGLWDVAPGGYIIHDFTEYNPSKAEVEEERKKKTARQDRWKQSRVASLDASLDASHNASKGGAPVPVPVPVPSVISTTLSYTQHLPEIGLSQQEQEASEPIGSAGGVKQKAEPKTISRPNSRLSCVRTVPRELASLADWFEAVFWKAYPRKESAPEAWKAIQSAFKGSTDAEGLQMLVMESLCAYRDCHQWTDATKIPHPATWLNRRPWEGDAPPATHVELPRAPLYAPKPTMKDKIDDLTRRHGEKLAQELDELGYPVTVHRDPLAAIR